MVEGCISANGWNEEVKKTNHINKETLVMSFLVSYSHFANNS
jgi:hypothetical protein